MLNRLPLRAGFLGCAAVLLGAAAGEDVTYDEEVFVSCEHRVAAIFPSQPMIRDLTYTTGGRTVPARQFYVEEGSNRFSVLVADFTNGPAVDEAIVESAAVPLRQRGEVRFQFGEDYDPGIPGRQLNIFEPNGRQHRASVYMADHRLYITEANAAPGDFSALQFEQSVSIIGPDGIDLDKNGNQPSRRYNCSK